MGRGSDDFTEEDPIVKPEKSQVRRISSVYQVFRVNFGSSLYSNVIFFYGQETVTDTSEQFRSETQREVTEKVNKTESQ